MKHRFVARTAGLFAVLALASCFGDSTGPGAVHQARFAVSPVFDARAIRLVNFDSVHVHLTRPADGSVALDTTIFFPANTDTLTLDLHVTITGSSEPFLLTMDMIDNTTHSVVFHSGPTTVTATYAANPTPVTPPVIYVGVGSHAAGVRWVQSPGSVYFQDTVTFIAEAFDSNNVTIANTPIDYTSSDSAKALPLASLPGKVVGGVQRGSATITASLLTNVPPVTRGLLVQPKPSAIAIQGGNNQTAPVGTAPPQQLVARVNAVDNLGVQGVVVTFAVTGGGGSLTKLVDTTDANGDAHTTWTLGATLGNQSVSATASGLTPSSVSFAATAIVGLPKKVAFITGGQPTNTAAGSPITPSVKVAVQDTFGNTVTSSTANVTVALGANPGSSTLTGTLTVAAVAGVATFSNLSLNNPGTAYTLTATSGTLTSGTSASFDVAGGIPAALAIVQQPTNGSGGAALAPAITVEIRDVLNNKVAGATNTVTVAIGNNPSGGSLGGTLSVPAVAGVATFSNLTVDKAGSGYTLVFASGGLTGATSTGFDISTGPATSLQFNVQPPSSAFFQAPFTTTVKALDAGGNIAAGFTGNVTVGIGTNPATGTVLGTTTVAAVAGVATFTGISIDNIGAGYTLSATSGALGAATSNALSIVSTPGINAWINRSGGNWSVGSNWSKGVTPVATDSVAIVQSGTYTVTLDVNATYAALAVGAPLGLQTLTQSANTLTMNGNGIVNPTGRYTISGGTLTGATTLDVNGAFDWQGGALGSGTGKVRVGGALTISGTAARTLSDFTLELGGSGTWTGAHTISSGSGGTLRVLAGGVLDLQGDAVFTFNLGGAPSVLQNLGTLNRTTSAGLATINAQLDNDGVVNLGSGALEVDAGSASADGAWNVGAGTVLNFNGGTHVLGAPGTVSGAGDVQFTSGTVNANGGWNVTGNTVVLGGTFNYNGTGTAAALGVSSGNMGGSGLMSVSTILSWSGGNFTGSAGTARVLAGGALNINGTNTRNLQNYILEVAGTGAWTGTHTIQTGSAGTLRVLAGGTLDIQGDPTLNFNLGGAASRLEVLGTLTRTLSTGTALITAQYDNDGVTTVSSGTLRLSGGTGGGSSDGTFTAASGALLDFSANTHTLGATGSVGGAGTVQVSGGTVTAAGGWSVTGTTQVTGGTLNANGAAMSTAALQLTSGAIGGANTGLLTVTGSMTWTAGNLSGTGGTTRVASGGTLAINGSATRNLQNYILELAGTGTWTGTHTIQAGSLGTLRILSGASLDIQGDAALVFNLGGTAPRVEVQGTVTRTVSTGAATISAEYDNDGQTTVSTGTLRLSGGSGAGTADGAYTVASGATLDFNGGTHGLGATSSLGGAGTALVSGGTVNAAGNWSHGGSTQVNGGALNYSAAGGSTTNLAVSSGSLGGTAPGVLTVTGAMTWTGGSLSGAAGRVRVQAGGTLSISGTTTRNLQSYGIELAGTGTWTGTHTVQTGSVGLIRILPGATLDIQGDPALIFNLGGTQSRVEVLGTLLRSTSANPAVITAAVDDSGTVQVTSGTLQLDAGGVSTGAFTAASGATLRFGGGTHSLTAASSVGGAGTVTIPGGTMIAAGAWSAATTLVNGGTATFDGPSMTTGALTVSAGSLGGAGALAVSGPLSWTGGNFSGTGGTTSANGTLSISGGATRNLQNYTVELFGAGTWTGTHTIQTGSGGVLRVRAAGTLDIQGGPTFTFNLGGGAPLFENLGTVTRTTSTGPAVINANFINSGSMSVASGSFTLLSSGTLGNLIDLNGTGSMAVQGGTVTLQPGLQVTSAGLVNTFTLISGSVVGLPTATDTAKIAVLNMSGGALSPAAGVVRVTQRLLWSAGDLTGNGKTLIPVGSALGIAGTATRNLTGQTLENAATGASWNGVLTVQAGSGGVIRNLPGGTLNISAGASFVFNLGGAAPLFDNQGQLTSSPGAGVTFTSSVPFSNTGTLNVSTGTLSLQGGGTQSGAVTVSAGAFLDFAGGTHTLANGFATSSTGLSRLTAGTMTTPSTADTARFTNLTLNSGTLSQPGGVVVSGTLDWAGGAAVSGTGMTRVLNTGSLTLTGAATRNFTNGIIENRGTATWTGSFTLQAGQGAILRNAVGATFTVSPGAGALFVSNLGGTQALFDNLGSFNYNASTVGATWSAAISSLAPASFAVTSNIFGLSGGGSLGGSPTVAAGASLNISGGTLTLKNGTNQTGAGQVALLSPGTVTVDSGGAATVTNFGVISGTLNHKATLTVNGFLAWQGGTIMSNVSGTGSGITRVNTGTQLAIAAAATKTLTGPHTLDIVSGAATGYFGGSGSIQTGLGAVIQNAGTLIWSGTGNILSNQGAPTAIIRNLASGTLRRDTSATLVTTDALLDNLGALNVVTGVMQLGGGSVNNFAGTANVGPANGLELFGGAFTPSYTMTGNFTVTGDLVMNNNTLILNQHKATISNNFSITGFGAVNSTFPLDTLDVNGNASLSSSGIMTNGGFRLAGNFSAASGGFTTGGSHTTLLDGAGVQTITFTNPANANFRRLEINKTGGSVTLLTDTRVTGTLRIISGTSVTGPTARLIVSDSIKSPTTLSSLTPLVVEVGNWLASDSGAFSPDTAVFNVGSATATPFVIPTGQFTTYVYKSIRVAADTVTLPVSLTVANDLVVGGLPSVTGTLAVPASAAISVNGNLRTEGSGKLKMTQANANLNVAGNASFAGASTAGLLTASGINVNGNFSQAGNAQSYAPTLGGSHRMQLGGTGTQNITMTNPSAGQSHFDVLSVTCPASRNVVIQTNILVQDSLIQTGGGSNCDIIGAGTSQRLSVIGTVRLVNQTAAPRLAPPVLELSGLVSLDSIFQAGRGVNPDTVVYLAGGTFYTGTPMRYKSARVATGAVISYTSGGSALQDIANDLIVSNGTLAMSGTDPLQVSGNFSTVGAGVLRMQSANSNIQVLGNADFSGGSTTGELTNGNFSIAGNFNQGGNAAAYAPSGSHFTNLFGFTAAGQTINFTNAGAAATSSHFQGLKIVNLTGPIGLTSNVFVNGAVADSNVPGEKIQGTSATVLTMLGASLNQIQFIGAPVVILDTLPSSQGLAISNVTFSGYATTVDQLTVGLRPNLTRTISGATFTVAPVGGHYLNLQWLASGAGTAPVLNMTSASPGNQGATANVIRPAGSFGPATLNWP